MPCSPGSSVSLIMVHSDNTSRKASQTRDTLCLREVLLLATPVPPSPILSRRRRRVSVPCVRQSDARHRPEPGRGSGCAAKVQAASAGGRLRSRRRQKGPQSARPR
eukprot:2434707-Rhodomonas_salina.2